MDSRIILYLHEPQKSKKIKHLNCIPADRIPSEKYI